MTLLKIGLVSLKNSDKNIFPKIFITALFIRINIMRTIKV